MMRVEDLNENRRIQDLSLVELSLLAEDIRRQLINTTAQTGGHLAPNLGIVELTLALHYVFDFSHDVITWDVGHQSYVHKLLTGRDKAFSTLRQYEGISGFPKRSESSYDYFGAGHASTSISAATGFAVARDLNREDKEVVAVIGDGAMTGGMVYEALNHAGHLKLNMTVILNDNDMSIDSNVGAISEYLTKVRSDPHYSRMKENIDGVFKKIPTLGPRVAEFADKVKDSIKSMVISGEFFEELGFKYFGPINGHDLPALIQVLENSKSFDRPVLIHCLTKKGKGYIPAELRPDKFHGTGAFHIQTGENKSKAKYPSYTSIFAKTLIKMAKEDERLLGITAAMPSGTGIGEFAKVFPRRSFDVGIAEEHATTLAAALALAGKKPILAIYSTFMQRGFDQLIHDCALQEAPVILALDRAGLVGEDGPTHHGVFDLSYLRMIPNMSIMAPKDENELQHMLYSANQYERLVALRYPRGEGQGVVLDETFKVLPYGKSEVLHEGKEAVLIAVGTMVKAALGAREILAQEGFDLGVVNARFVKPLDTALLDRLISEGKMIFTLEDNVLAGGFGAGVGEYLHHAGASNTLVSFGIEDEFVEHGKVALLYQKLGLDAEGLAKRMKKILSK
jgi:1-deoxy-D-xylulose-5-phosphate synthase